MNIRIINIPKIENCTHEIEKVFRAIEQKSFPLNKERTGFTDGQGTGHTEKRDRERSISRRGLFKLLNFKASRIFQEYRQK